MTGGQKGSSGAPHAGPSTAAVPAHGEDPAAALEALDRARRRFIAVAGHELRTPVTTIRGLADEAERELRDAPPSRVSEEVLPALVRSARRVEALLDDLLLALDITTALPVGDPEPVDLVGIAAAAWDARDLGAPLEIAGERQAVVDVRPVAADRMVEAILDNAARYGIEPFVLDARAEDGTVRLTVSSGGPPLAADDVALAFEVFYRGEAAVTTAPGFGLGLPVARALARQHGGDVVLEPRDGGGLAVTVVLPTAP